MRGAYLLCLPLLAILGGCTPPPMSGCPGGNTGPSVRYGSLNLTPTVGVVMVGGGLLLAAGAGAVVATMMVIANSRLVRYEGAIAE